MATGFTNLHNFNKRHLQRCHIHHGDGADLAHWFNIGQAIPLYGAASGGGLSERARLFSSTPDGSGFTNLHSYTMGNTTNGDEQYILRV